MNKETFENSLSEQALSLDNWLRVYDDSRERAVKIEALDRLVENITKTI